MTDNEKLQDELKQIEEHFDNLTAEQYKLNKKKIDFGKVKFACDCNYVKVFQSML